MKALARACATVMVGGLVWFLYALILELTLRSINAEHNLATVQFCNLLALAGADSTLVGQVVTAGAFGLLVSAPLALLRVAEPQVEDGGLAPLRMVLAGGVAATLTTAGSVVVYVLGAHGAFPAPYTWRPLADVALARADATAQVISFFALPLGWMFLVVVSVSGRALKSLAPLGYTCLICATYAIAQELCIYWWCPQQENDTSHVSYLVLIPLVVGVCGAAAGVALGFFVSWWLAEPTRPRLPRRQIRRGLLAIAVTSASAAFVAFHLGVQACGVGPALRVFGSDTALAVIPGCYALLAARLVSSVVFLGFAGRLAVAMLRGR